MTAASSTFDRRTLPRSFDAPCVTVVLSTPASHNYAADRFPGGRVAASCTSSLNLVENQGDRVFAHYGLDLHRSCRRVVHHDLAWNPAQLEQRVGRVDRLGSLTARLRAKDPSVTLDILYPLIKNTIDDRLYRAVHAREKWLEFLLGAKPDFKEYWLGEELPPPLPDSMAARLRIDLGPR